MDMLGIFLQLSFDYFAIYSPEIQISYIVKCNIFENIDFALHVVEKFCFIRSRKYVKFNNFKLQNGRHFFIYKFIYNIIFEESDKEQYHLWN